MNGIEKSIARAVASALIGAGHKISVDFAHGCDTEEQYRDLTDLDKIIEACDAVDECWFMLDAERDYEGSKATAGWVCFIWGNGDEGRTCVSDYTTNLEPLLEHIWPWAESAECVLVPRNSDQLRQAYAQLETTARDLLAEIERCSPSDLNRLPTGEVAALKGTLAQVERAKKKG